MNHLNACITLSLLGNGLLLAQTPGSPAAVFVERPVLGFAFDEAAGAVRPIRGLAGAGIVDDPLEFGGKLARFALSAQNDYGLGALAGDERLLMFRFGQGKISSRILAEAPSLWDVAVLSPAGTAALVVDRLSGQAAVFTGLPASPQIRGRLSVLYGADIPDAIAVSDDGNAILAVYAQGDSGYLLRLAPDGTAQMLSSPAGPGHLTFIAGSDDALVASEETRQVYLLRNVTRDAQLIPLGGPLDQLQGRLHVASPSGGGRVFAVGEESSDIAIIDMADRTVSYLSCDCVTSELTLLNVESLYLLNGLSSRPLWMLDGNPRNTRLYFVPGYQPAGAPAFSAVEPAPETNDIPTLRLDVPAVVRAGDQFQIAASLDSIQSREWKGQLRLDFAADQDGSAGDELLQFSTGGRVVEFTVPAGSTEVRFPQGSMYLQTGLSAGRIVLTPLFSSESGYSPSSLATEILANGGSTATVNFLSGTGSTAGKPVYDLVISGTTSGGPNAVRTVAVTVGGDATVKCTGCPGGVTGVIDVTTQFRNYLSGLTCGTCSYAIRVTVTIEGSLLNIKSGEVDFLDGVQRSVCIAPFPLGQFWPPCSTTP